MPNWCNTQYYVDGDSSQIEELYSIIKNLEANEAKKENLSNLDEFPCHLIIDACFDHIDYAWTRSFWSNLKKYYTPSEKPYIYFEVRSAWDVEYNIEESILHKFDKVKVYYYAYEPGCSLLLKNDKEGKYFDAKFKLSLNMVDNSYFEKDYKTEEDLAKDVYLLLKGNPVKTLEDVYNAFNVYSDGFKQYLGYSILKVEEE